MSDRSELCESRFHTLPGGPRMRYALFATPSGAPRGTILVAPGRREFIEKKIAEMVPEFLERNFRLIIFEWRGQGLSDHVLDGAMRQRNHITDFGIYLDDLCSFYESVVRQHQAGPLLALGHSMGAHLIMRWLAERQTTGVHAAICTAPMLAIGPRSAHATALGFGRIAVALGRGKSYGPGQHDYGPLEREFANNPLTHDRERFNIIQNYFDAFPDMATGGVTWEWLLAALRSMRDMRNGPCLGRITLPVLAMTGGQDRVTPALELERYLPQLPQGKSIIIPNARHDLLNEVDTYRTETWRHIDLFLSRVMAA